MTDLIRDFVLYLMRSSFCLLTKTFDFDGFKPGEHIALAAPSSIPFALSLAFVSSSFSLNRSFGSSTVIFLIYFSTKLDVTWICSYSDSTEYGEFDLSRFDLDP